MRPDTIQDLIVYEKRRRAVMNQPTSRFEFRWGKGNWKVFKELLAMHSYKLRRGDTWFIFMGVKQKLDKRLKTYKIYG